MSGRIRFICNPSYSYEEVKMKTDFLIRSYNFLNDKKEVNPRVTFYKEGENVIMEINDDDHYPDCLTDIISEVFDADMHWDSAEFISWTE